MKAKLIKETLNEQEGIPWSGSDPTKAPVIGKLLTRPMDLGDYKLEPEMLEVVEIYKDFYVINKWYKPGVPQIIHKDMVNTFIADEDFKEKEESIKRKY